MKYDYFIPLANPGEIPIFKLHIKSLIVNTNVSRLNILVGISQRGGETDNVLIGICNELKLPYVLIPYYKQFEIRGIRSNSRGKDTANKLDKMIRSFGKNNWVVCVHSDIIYIQNLVKLLDVECVNDEVGMMNDWRLGLTVLNKKMYDTSHFGFWNLERITSGVDRYHNCLRIFGANDPGYKYIDSILPCDSVDVSCFLRIECQDYGWIYKDLPFGLFEHLGEQSVEYIDDKSIGDESIEAHKKFIRGKREQALHTYSNYL